MTWLTHPGSWSLCGIFLNALGLGLLLQFGLPLQWRGSVSSQGPRAALGGWVGLVFIVAGVIMVSYGSPYNAAGYGLPPDFLSDSLNRDRR